MECSLVEEAILSAHQLLHMQSLLQASSCITRNKVALMQMLLTFLQAHLTVHAMALTTVSMHACDGLVKKAVCLGNHTSGACQRGKMSS